MKPSDLRDKTDDELARILAEKRDFLMKFRMQSATGVVDNVKGARETRRDIARINTILNERRRAAAPGAKRSS